MGKSHNEKIYPTQPNFIVLNSKDEFSLKRNKLVDVESSIVKPPTGRPRAFTSPTVSTSNTIMTTLKPHEVQEDETFNITKNLRIKSLQVSMEKENILESPLIRNVSNPRKLQSSLHKGRSRSSDEILLVNRTKQYPQSKLVSSTLRRNFSQNHSSVVLKKFASAVVAKHLSTRSNNMVSCNNVHDGTSFEDTRLIDLPRPPSPVHRPPSIFSKEHLHSSRRMEEIQHGNELLMKTSCAFSREDIKVMVREAINRQLNEDFPMKTKGKKVKLHERRKRNKKEVDIKDLPTKNYEDIESKLPFGALVGDLSNKFQDDSRPPISTDINFRNDSPRPSSVRCTSSSQELQESKASSSLESHKSLTSSSKKTRKLSVPSSKEDQQQFVALSSVETTLSASEILSTEIASTNSSRVLSPNSPRVLSANSSRVLSANSSRVLSANSPRVLSANSSRVLSANSSRVLSANSSRVLSANSSRVLSANSSRVLSANSSRVSSAKSSKRDPSTMETTSTPVLNHFCYNGEVYFDEANTYRLQVNAAVNIQRIFRGHTVRKYLRELRRSAEELQQRRKSAQLFAEKNYAAHVKRIHNSVLSRDQDLNDTHWMKEYGKNLKLKEKERSRKLKEQRKKQTKHEMKLQANVNNKTASTDIHEIFQDKRPTKAQRKAAALTIQKFVRGWLVRINMKRCKAKVEKRSLNFESFIHHTYIAHIKDILNRHGLIDQNVSLNFDEVLQYVNKRNKYEAEFIGLTKSATLKYETLSLFFENCRHFPSTKEINDAAKVVLGMKTIKEIESHEFTKQDMVNIAFHIYPPQGAHVECNRKSTWLNPLIHGEEARKFEKRKRDMSVSYEKCVDMVSESMRTNSSLR